MENTLYSYTPIVDRPPLAWPNDARVAFYVALNIEHFPLDRPGMSISPTTAHLIPDPLNYSWRDYGVRVGVWRVMNELDRYGVRASVLLNSDVCERYPQIIEAGRERNWAWLAHGKNNTILQTGFDEGEEREYLTSMLAEIEQATGQRPIGWLGPAMSETFATPRLLADLGVRYVLDWCCDDQPFALNVPGMLSVPYQAELNDLRMFVGRSTTADEYVKFVKDQFDTLYDEGSESGRVMSLVLHPFVIGQAFRRDCLRTILEYITTRDGVWVTTSDEIATHYAKAVPPS